MIRRILWRATTALIVLTMTVPFVQAAPTPAIAVDEPAVMAPKARPPESEGAGESKWKLVSSGTSAAEVTEPAIYIIQLEDAPVASYRGGIEGLEGTNPGVQGEVQLDVSSPESIAYTNYLEQQQAKFIDAMERSVEHSVEVRFQYRYAYNGVAAELTAVEAAEVAKLPTVIAIQPEFVRYPTTDYGPDWIGAPGIWDGSSTGGLPGTLGEGIVVGVLDTGTNLDHPSFAEVGPVDGYVHENPLGSGNYLGLCASDPGAWMCNDKLIGYYIFTGDTHEDWDGHGSNVASVAAGNFVTATLDITVTNPFTYQPPISGVAPHANIVAYDVCLDGPPGSPETGCPGSAIMAGIDQAVADGIDVINYSIGGGSANPWTSGDAVAFLGATDAGIIPVTSAGNDGPDPATMGSPADAPWMLSAGASTHNRLASNGLINMSGGDSPPADIVGAGLGAAYGPAPIVHAGDFGDALCQEPFPANTWTNGEIVVCDRGIAARVEKGANVLAGGAGGYVLANVDEQGEAIAADPHILPGVHIGDAAGDILRAWLASGSGHTATIAGTTLDLSPSNGDIMADFSSRGPNPSVPGLVKPDVTAPGVSILGAYRTGRGTQWDIEPWMDEYSFVSGTSQASPHAAGGAALMRALHPEWSVAETKSALMMTSWPDDVRKEDAVTPADPFDMGSGSLRAGAAGGAGLVLNETTQGFVDADPDAGGDPTTLNLASMANDLCLQRCSWERTFRSTVDVASTYTVVVDAVTGMTVTVDPVTFTVPPYGTQVVEVEADVSAMPLGEWAFGDVSLETDAEVPEFTADWEEGFEGAYPPAGWATYITGDPADPGFITTTIAHSGNQAIAHFDDDLDTTGDSWLVTPQFTPTVQTQLAFWQLTYWDSYYDYHGIWVSDGSADPDAGDFAEFVELDSGTGGSWQRMVQDLGSYAGTPIYVAFRYIGDYNDWWVIDDIMAGEITDSARLSDLHIPIAVLPSASVLPDLAEVETRRNAGSQLIEDLQALEITDLTLDYYGLAEGDLLDFQLSQDPTHDVPSGFFDDLDQVFYRTMTVAVTDQRLVAEIIETTSPDLDMAVGRDVDGDGPEEAEIVCQSATGGAYEYCDISGADLVAGDWWIIVMNWEESANLPDDITMAVALVGADSGNMTVTGPDAVPEKDEFDLRLFWDEPRMEAGDHWYGAISIGTDPAHQGNVGTIPVNLLRRQDDVTKSVSPREAEAGDTVTYTISIQPDITSQELTYYVADTLPDGVTYVPGSATAGSGTLSVVDNRLTWSGQVIPPREYMVSTSLDDPLCTMPLANSGAYVDLEAYSYFAHPAISGDNVAFQEATYPGDLFAFFGDPRTNVLYFTDDGYASLDLDSVLIGPVANAPIPTAGLPNALMAMLWNDMEIVYEAGTGESNRGATIGVYLITTGVPSHKLLEFDDIQKVGDPSSQIDFEMLIAEAVNDAAGEYEVVFAYDNLTGDFNSLSSGTIGVEDYDGSVGTQYAYNDANLQTLEDGMAICFDYVIPPKPVEITYRATVDADAAGTLVNAVWHNTDNPGSRPAMVSAEVAVPHKLYLPLIFSNYTPPTRVTILHTNDEHGRLQPFVAFASPITEGGAANLMARLTEDEGYSPRDDGFLLLSGGDSWTGPSISTWFEGEPVVDVMNAMGYDASAIGNHEFDFGRECLERADC